MTTTDTILLTTRKHQDYHSTMEKKEEEEEDPSIIMPPLTAFPEFLLVISPFRRPITWSVINVLCMIWCYLLLDQFGEPGPRETEHGNELYLAWNFWTTFLWCIEAGLCSHYHYYHRHSMRRLDNLIDVVQFVVAVYFLVDSIQLYRASRRPGEKIYGEVTDVFLSFAAYLGASIYYMSLHYQGRSGQDELSVPSCEREMTCTESEEVEEGFGYANIA
ncbi:hypothetical protein FisN_3Lh476 [Fistulifera solaris]|uniref:Uncharacterized protein n=1 Tax=Fistulifera solaris TaxID=1519565 RepID=A0A1Z5J8E6_FISSO|nr:hypothetical protein FisN_3Lh476 [Fistulifera solaris]|eukprot:GAX10274.1 hypothetical protein FisN_3Lh476 [Fistulifera solaris]